MFFLLFNHCFFEWSHCVTLMQPNTALPAVHASLLLTTLSSLPFPSHIKKVSVGPLLKTNQWLIFRLIFMFVKVSQTITKYVLTLYVMPITGTGASASQHTGAPTAAGQQVAPTPANMNKGAQTWTSKCNQANTHEWGQANTNEGGWVNTNESGQMRVGERVQVNESGGMGAGKCDWGWASMNKGGGAMVAAAATAGPPSPPFIYSLSFSLSEMATIS